MNQRLYLILALLILVMAAVVGIQGIVEQEDRHKKEGLGEERGRFDPIYSRPIRQTGSKGESKSMSSKEALDLLWKMVEEDLKPKGYQETLAEMKARLFEGKDRDVGQYDVAAELMKHLNYRHALLLFQKFYREDGDVFFSSPNDSLASYIAYQSIEKMAELDAVGALLFLEETGVDFKNEYLCISVALGMSCSDPASALAWWKGNVENRIPIHILDSPYSLMTMDAELYQRFSAVDFESALAEARKEKDYYYRIQAYLGVIKGLPDGVDYRWLAENQQFDLGGAEFNAQSIPKGTLHIQQELALRWIKEDVAAALAWYSTLRSHDPFEGEDLSLGALSGGAHDDDPFGGSSVKSSLIHQWAKKDPESFLMWAKNQEDREHVVRYYYNGYQNKTALDFTAQLEGSEDRVKILREVIDGRYEAEVYDTVSDPFGGPVDAEELRTSLEGMHRDYYDQRIWEIQKSTLSSPDKQALLQWLEQKKKEEPRVP